MSNKHFAKTPNIDIPRSRYGMPFEHKTSFFHGDLVPIDCFPVIPGDTFSLTLSSLIRMSTPIFPIMDNINYYIHAYFVPWRLLWKHTEEFFGANKTSAGPQTTEYLIPAADCADTSFNVHSVADYLGIPPDIGYDDQVGGNSHSYINVLKARGLWMIWSEMYRAQQLQDPFVCDMGDTGAIGTIGLTSLSLGDYCPKVCKEFDYFTAATLYPQYGAAVELPLGTYAPVITKAEQQVWTSSNPAEAPLMFTHLNGSYYSTDRNLAIRATNTPSANSLNAFATISGTTSDNDNVVPVNLYADLSNATAAKINDIRYAFAVQRYLERANFGTRYFEVLNIHYGVTSPDSRLQRPEYLGGTRFNINIQQVLSTADYQPGTTSKLGETGAVSVTVNKSHIFTKGIVEFGYIYVLGFARQEQTYGQGIRREDFLRSKWEIYSPEFAHLGDQEVKLKEIYAISAKGLDTFGYQEHWAELRYRPNQVSGKLNPARGSGSLDYMTLANNFTSKPVLGDAFIKESRDNITRCLTTGATGPDYIADFYFDYKANRVLPLYSIPGLLDHFGNM